MTTQQQLEGLLEDLHSDRVEQRAAAAEALCQALPESACMVPHLIQACADEESVRVWACEALESMEEPPSEQMGEIAKLCGSGDSLVAYWALTMLGRLGPAAIEYQDMIASLLSSCDELSVKQRAAWALGKLGANSSQSVAALKEAAQSEDPRLSRLAKAAI